ncbi:MAG TPA: sensor histidine kinase [Telluria sp.]|nr:sensor histidine kinase [Telluria sp.]
MKASPKNISTFITANLERILEEWESFAATFGAVADKMSVVELRDHAKQILEFIAADIKLNESAAESALKSKGRSSRPTDSSSASSIHGRLRHTSGFTLLQLIAEYRALRASVLRLWENENPNCSDASTRDITRFNESIDQSLAEAAVAYSEKANQTRDMFIAILGHDLRSPIAATALAGSFLTKAGVGDEQTHQIGVRVKRSSATMSGMVNDLLELARTQMGDGIPIVRQHCDIMEVCQWSMEDASAAHPFSQFLLETEGDLLGTFDRAKLQQVVTNLLNNAAQYGDRDAPVVVHASGDATEVTIEVRNKGKKIPSRAIKHLFESFVQAGGDVSHPRTSLGLGLFIAYEIVLAHSGTLSVKSDDELTVFTARIPRC